MKSLILALAASAALTFSAQALPVIPLDGASNPLVTKVFFGSDAQKLPGARVWKDGRIVGFVTQVVNNQTLRIRFSNGPERTLSSNQFKVIHPFSEDAGRDLRIELY
jgi:hypothetical protein